MSTITAKWTDTQMRDGYAPADANVTPTLTFSPAGEGHGGTFGAQIPSGTDIFTCELTINERGSTTGIPQYFAGNADTANDGLIDLSSDSKEAQKLFNWIYAYLGSGDAFGTDASFKVAKGKIQRIAVTIDIGA